MNTRSRKTSRTTKTTRKAWEPASWQRDPESITTQRVQLWTIDGCMAGQISQAEARRRVAEGTAFVICEQAINVWSKA